MTETAKQKFLFNLSTKTLAHVVIITMIFCLAALAAPDLSEPGSSMNFGLSLINAYGQDIEQLADGEVDGASNETEAQPLDLANLVMAIIMFALLAAVLFVTGMIRRKYLYRT